MRKQFCFWLFAAIVFSGCSGSASKKDEKKTETGTNEQTTQSDVKSSNTKSTDETQKRIDELKKLSPISTDQLKSFFPEEVMGMKRNSFSVNSAMGYAMGTAEYKKDTGSYRVMIYDCAGEAGASFYGLRYMTGWSMESENDNGYTKTTNFMGSKALETFNKGSNEYSLNFVKGDRFWVTTEGSRTGLDNLKTFAQNLDLDKLNNIK